MKLSIQSKPLLEALAAASKVVAGRTNLPALSCALLESHEGGMRVSCDSLEARLTIDVPDVDFDEPFAFLAPVRQLQYALRADKADLSIVKERLIVESGGKSTLGMLPVGEFPEPWKQVPRHNVDAAEFIGALRMTANCAADSGLGKPQLSTVHFDPSCSRMVGCDGGMLAATPVAMLMDEPFLLPTELARTILSTFRQDDEVTIGVATGVFCVASPRRTMWAKLMESAYPAYAQVIPNKGELLTLKREELEGSVKNLNGFMDEWSRIDITQSKEAWTMTATAHGHESSVDVAISRRDKKPVLEPLRIPAAKLLKVIQHWTCDVIDVTIGERALLFKPSGAQNPIGVVALLTIPGKGAA